jgi:hypothetical protein
MGKVGKRFVQSLAEEWRGVRMRQWNSERPLIFCAVILSRKSNVIRAATIRETIEKRLDLWDAGSYDGLVQEVLIAGKCGVAGRNSHSWKEDGEVSESVTKKYNSMVLDGKLRGAVRFATGRGLGGPLQPTDKCSKSGDLVIDVLRKKHPRIRKAAEGSLKINGEEAFPDGVIGFDHYPSGIATPLPIGYDSEVMLTIAKTLDGGPGPCGVDARLFQLFFTRFGTASEYLRVEWAKWSKWLCNESPPYAAYRALNAKREVGLDKVPGTRPVAVGEIWMRCTGKAVVKDTGDQAKLACGSVQLCAGLEAGIEGSLHAVRLTSD